MLLVPSSPSTDTGHCQSGCQFPARSRAKPVEPPWTFAAAPDEAIAVIGAAVAERGIAPGMPTLGTPALTQQAAVAA